MGKTLNNFILENPDEWELMEVDNTQHLHYIGNQKDLSQLVMPKMKDGSSIPNKDFMFLGCNAEIGPIFDEGTMSVRYATAQAKNMLTAAQVPDTVIDQTGQNDGNENLKDAGNISKNAQKIDLLWSECKSLESIPSIPDSVVSAESALEGCEGIEEFEGGKNIINGVAMCAGCSNLKYPSPDLNPEGNFSDAFVDCPSIVETVPVELEEEQQAQQQVQSGGLDRDATLKELDAGIQGEVQEPLLDAER